VAGESLATMGWLGCVCVFIGILISEINWKNSNKLN
jgi:drug/metabolite transporter (DMT)-like permease